MCSSREAISPRSACTVCQTRGISLRAKGRTKRSRVWSASLEMLSGAAGFGARVGAGVGAEHPLVTHTLNPKAAKARGLLSHNGLKALIDGLDGARLHHILEFRLIEVLA